MLLQFLDKYNKFGCIGRADELEKQYFAICFAIGKIIGYMDKEILSGNANGSDNAFAQGINSVAPASLNLYLPNKGHNQGFIDAENEIILDTNNKLWIELAEKHHPRYYKMKPYVKNLFNRNVGIALNSDAIIAFPNQDKAGWGGTGHTIRVAKDLGKEVFILEDSNFLETKKELAKALKFFSV